MQMRYIVLSALCFLITAVCFFIGSDPLRRGFTNSYRYKNCDKSFASWKPKKRNSAPLECNTIMFQKAVSVLDNLDQSVPFFMFLSPMSPHPPLVLPKKYQSSFRSILQPNESRRATVLTMMQEFDDGVGSVLESLKRRQLVDKTIVIFMNDNGAPRYENKSDMLANFPLKGFKGELHEGGIRSQLYIQWPGHIQPLQEISQPTISLDLAPSILHVADPGKNMTNGLAYPFDGTNLFRLVSFYPGSISKADYQFYQNMFQNRALFWRFNMVCKEEFRALRRGDMKWVSKSISPGNAVKSSELYNITADIEESINLSNIFPRIVTEFEKMHFNWESLMPPIYNRIKTNLKCPYKNT